MSPPSRSVPLRAWWQRLTLVGALLVLHGWALAQGVALQLLNLFACIAGALACLYAIARIAFLALPL